MGTHYRAVDKDFLEISISGEMRKEMMPNTLPRPSGKALVVAIPETKLNRQIAPRTASARNPEHGLNK
jgi:hypothetical protein